MMHTFDADRFEAFVQILAGPDPVDLPRPLPILRYGGDPDRRTTRFHPILMGWLQQRYLDLDGERPLGPATRAWKRVVRVGPLNSGVRVLRPAVTG